MLEATRTLSTIDELDFRILALLEAHPLASKTAIAKRLGCKPETVATHIRASQERGVYAGSYALISYPRLELQRLLVAVGAPLKNLPAINAVCRAHPYVARLESTQGGIDGALVTLITPPAAMHLLAELFDKLAAERTIDDYRMYLTDDGDLEFLTPTLNMFDPASGVCNFDWERWEEDGPRTSVKHEKHMGVHEPGLHMLTQTDLELLCVISQNKIAGRDARIRSESNSHRIRRGIRFLTEQGFIIGYKAAIAYRQFGLSNNVLFKCNVRPSALQKCKAKILELPFPGTFIPTQEGFFLQATVPLEGPRSILRLLSKLCEDVELSWCALASVYDAPLNSTAYVNGAWRTDRRFIVEEPLRATKEISTVLD